MTRIEQLERRIDNLKRAARYLNHEDKRRVAQMIFEYLREIRRLKNETR